ncbi:hypothetical protein GNI_049630 [Gregarina niphandrodes]|uniref:Uncharacterized protein n=1 Tax=Gregarina niphandrodes TaxID=110365 RepID=A0A023B9L6_GRENI|nr:hypothetical protein GNI_049630 [Gregarina niphandrodes]EZG72986.1 hypothetical protein GNI_049630 [Gregarina niphandrodes]|eukprot:XP_011129681.1 hypothetical protein GNI_049630 [Gregarina niphandrodes]
MESRLLRNLDSKISAKEYYDAHQLVRALFERYARKGDLRAGVDFADKYAEVFAEHGQFELCVNLGQRVLRLMQTTDQMPTGENIGKLAVLFCLCGPNSTDSKYEYMNQVIQWSKRNPEASEEEKRDGAHDLHSMIADAYLNENKFGACQNHLVFCDDIDAMVDLTRRWQETCYPTEKWLIPLRLTLILLCNKKFQVAKSYLDKCFDSWNSPDCPAPLQMAYLTWAACQHNSLELYETVSRKYALIFRLDEGIARLFETLQSAVFKIQKQHSGILDMMSQFLAGAPPLTA